MYLLDEKYLFSVSIGFSNETRLLFIHIKYQRIGTRIGKDLHQFAAMEQSDQGLHCLLLHLQL